MPEDEVAPITVIGKRTSWGVYVEPAFSPPTAPSGDTDELDDELTEPTQNEQDRMKRDCAAKEFRQRMNDAGRNRDGREWVSLIYRRNGRIYATQLRTQGGGGFTQGFLEGLMTEFGITRGCARLCAQS